MKKNVIALDVDGILANFYLAVCKRFNQQYKSIDEWYLEWLKPKMFDAVARDNEFWQTLPILNPPEAITFDFDCYMTAVPKDQLASRSYWLGYNGFPPKDIIVSHNKIEDCEKYGINILVDDKPDTIIKSLDSNIKGIRFLPQYMNFDFNSNYKYDVIRHLDEVNKFI